MTYKILIATPQPDFGELVRLNIEEGGEYEATLVKTGKEVMETANATKFDLVVLDASLTDKPFIPLAQNLMDENPNLKIIVIPPNNDPKDPSLEEIIYHGMLSRPFYPPDLVEMVNEILISHKVNKPESEPEKPVEEAEEVKEMEETVKTEEEPAIEEEIPETVSSMDLDSIANILSEAANPPQIVSGISEPPATDNAGSTNKDSVIGPINEEDFAKEVEALFAQEGIKGQPSDALKEIQPPQSIEELIVTPPVVEAPQPEPPVVQEEKIEEEPTYEDDSEALALQLAAQIRAQTETSAEISVEDNDLLKEAEGLFTEPEKKEPEPVNHYLEMSPPTGSTIQPVKQEPARPIDDEEANETYEELVQDNEALAKKHSDMANQYKELANEYLSLAKEHSDMAKFHSDLAKEKARLAKEKETMLKRKVELVSEIYQTQQSLKQIITQTTAIGAMILKSGDLVAQVGKLNRDVFTEVSEILNTNWDDDKKSDLVRFMHLQTDSADYLLYASLIRDDFTLGLIYDLSTPVSVMRKQSSQITHALAGEPLIEMLKLPVNDLEKLSDNQSEAESYGWIPESAITEEPDNSSISADEVFRNVLAQLNDQAVKNPDSKDDLVEEGLKFESIDGEIITFEDDDDEIPEQFIDYQSILAGQQQSLKETQPDDDLDNMEILQSVNNQISRQHVDVEDEVNEDQLLKDFFDNDGEIDDVQPNPVSKSSLDETTAKEDETNDKEYDLDDLIYPWEEDDQIVNIVNSSYMSSANRMAGHSHTSTAFAPEMVQVQEDQDLLIEPVISGKTEPHQVKENKAPALLPEKNMVENKSKSTLLMASHTYTCLLAPRFANIQLTSEMRKLLSDQMSEISTIFGWKLINLVIDTDYFAWSFEVLPSISKESMIRVVRHRTSKLLITHFSQFSELIEGGDFWANESLSNNKPELPDQKTVQDFLTQIR